MPEIEIVDLKEEELLANSQRVLIGKKLSHGLYETLGRREQAMVFVNRKGYASFLSCNDCGHVPKCLNCSVSLTYYQRARKMRCHYCSLEMPMIESCPKCNSRAIKYMGMGTELIESEVKNLFPDARVARLDAESADTSAKLEKTLGDFREGKIDILVGTQMLAKGHDFPNVTFVGVVLADIALHLPDFRAGERTFQLLAQVSGRAGRADKPGRVVIQTMLPEHYVLKTAATHDYQSFYTTELEFRRTFGYPPFSRMAQLEFRHANETKARDEAMHAKAVLDHLKITEMGVMYLGPAAASIARIANQYRWQILLKSEKLTAMNAVIRTLRKEGLRFIDVDPVSTL